MIVKFHPRGSGSGPVGYLLGKDRQREEATVLQGKPEEVRELIDASPYAKKYTSGVLSFAESDLAPGQREKLMESFERVLMPGLDKDQYSVLWVELNFLIPNTELLSGKRLQPYYDRADRPHIDAWQTVVNGRLRLHDPNAPANRRALVTPSALPKTQQEAAHAITAGLLSLTTDLFFGGFAGFQFVSICRRLSGSPVKSAIRFGPGLRPIIVILSIVKRKALELDMLTALRIIKRA